MVERRRLKKQKPIPREDHGTPDIRPTADEEKELRRFQKLLLIDENGLDDALMDQAELFQRVSDRLALAISERDAAKQALLNTEAAVDSRLRRDAQNSDERITEKEVESLKRQDDDVFFATEEHLRKAHLVHLWGAMKEAFQQRSYALSKLVDLHLAGYFGDVAQRGSGNKAKALRSDYHRRATAEGQAEVQKAVSRRRVR